MENLNETNFCECCGRALNNKRIAELELNMVNGLYCVPGTVPENESQGIFTFGKSCAKKILNNGGMVEA